MHDTAITIYGGIIGNNLDTTLTGPPQCWNEGVRIVCRYRDRIYVLSNQGVEDFKLSLCCGRGWACKNNLHTAQGDRSFVPAFLNGCEEAVAERFGHEADSDWLLRRGSRSID